MDKRSLCFLLTFCVAVSTAHTQDLVERESGVWVSDSLGIELNRLSKNRMIIRAAESLGGKLEIITGDQENVQLAYRKVARTASRRTAFDYIDLITVNLTTTGAGSRLELRAPNPPPWDRETESGQIEAILRVPVDIEVEVQATYFDIEARGPFRSVSVPASLGRLSVSRVSQKLELSTANRRVEIRDIIGEIRVSTSNASLIAETVRAVGAQASFRNEAGEIRLEDVEGSLNVRNAFARTAIYDYRATDVTTLIRNSSGPIELNVLEFSGGQLVLSNRHEDIDILLPDNVSAYLSLAVDTDGRIETSGLRLQPDLIQRDRLSAIAGEGTADVDASIRGTGNIFVRGTRKDLD